MPLTAKYLLIVLCTLSVVGRSGLLAASDESVSELRTPKALETPQINGAKVYGIRPGHFFLYRIPCTAIWVGNARDIEEPAKSTQLTREEQYSYISMWSLTAAPLFFSGDMTALDPFTLNVLCNSEVIDIDQDSLGKQARILRKTGQEFVPAKSLEDGSVALGLFNLTVTPRIIRVRLTELGIGGR